MRCDGETGATHPQLLPIPGFLSHHLFCSAKAHTGKRGDSQGQGARLNSDHWGEKCDFHPDQLPQMAQARWKGTSWLGT